MKERDAEMKRKRECLEGDTGRKEGEERERERERDREQSDRAREREREIEGGRKRERKREIGERERERNREREGERDRERGGEREEIAFKGRDRRDCLLIIFYAGFLIFILYLIISMLYLYYTI